MPNVKFNYTRPEILLEKGSTLGDLLGPVLNRLNSHLLDGFVLPTNDDVHPLLSMYTLLENRGWNQKLSSKSQISFNNNLEELQSQHGQELSCWDRFKLLVKAQNFMDFSKEVSRSL